MAQAGISPTLVAQGLVHAGITSIPCLQPTDNPYNAISVINLICCKKNQLGAFEEHI